MPDCHGAWCFIVRVEVGALVDVLEVGDVVRHVAEVELLDPAEADQAGGHPVGQDDDVPAGVLAASRLAWIVPKNSSLALITSW